MLTDNKTAKILIYSTFTQTSSTSTTYSDRSRSDIWKERCVWNDIFTLRCILQFPLSLITQQLFRVESSSLIRAIIDEAGGKKSVKMWEKLKKRGCGWGGCKGCTHNAPVCLSNNVYCHAFPVFVMKQNFTSGEKADGWAGSLSITPPLPKKNKTDWHNGLRADTLILATRILFVI